MTPEEIEKAAKEHAPIPPTSDQIVEVKMLICTLQRIKQDSFIAGASHVMKELDARYKEVKN